MDDLDGLLERLEQLLLDVEELEVPLRDRVFELLDGVDTLHRMALGRLATQLDPVDLQRAADVEPAAAWLLEAYGILVPSPSPQEVSVELGPTHRRS
jgi:hypothetical protein